MVTITVAIREQHGQHPASRFLSRLVDPQLPRYEYSYELGPRKSHATSRRKRMSKVTEGQLIKSLPDQIALYRNSVR
jgi:hypothetical protein